MKDVTLRSPLLVLLNLCGVIIYLLIASQTWLEPQLAGVEVAKGGDGVIWFSEALPILVIFAAINTSFVLFQLFKYLKKKKADFSPVLICLPVLWAVGIYIDFTNH